MEKRNITITLATAKEWYNKSAELRELALQAFKKEEILGFKAVKTFEQALKVLDFTEQAISTMQRLAKTLPKNVAATLKLTYIIKACNAVAGYPDKCDVQNIFYPIIFVKKISKDALLCETCSNGAYPYRGPACLNADYYLSSADGDLGFLQCATEDIAIHISKTFCKLLGEFMYGDTYNIVGNSTDDK